MDFIYNLRLARYYLNETRQFCFSNKSSKTHKHMSWWAHSSPSKALHGQVTQVHSGATRVPELLPAHTWGCAGAHLHPRDSHSSLQAPATPKLCPSTSLHSSAASPTLRRCSAKLESRGGPASAPRCLQPPSPAAAQPGPAYCPGHLASMWKNFPSHF